MNLPRHVAMIMDGNGRWAQQRGLPRIEGHRRGADTVRRVTELAAELRLDALTLYCLSSENWKRPREELDFLMDLLCQYLVDERPNLREQDLRLQFIGRLDRLSPEVRAEMKRTRDHCRHHAGMRLVLAIDYGGRDELTRVTRDLAKRVQTGVLSPDAIDERTISASLDTGDLPDVDLMIRTGGDTRISNFLLWQLSYAELWFTPTCWPDFQKDDFQSALDEFSRRQRRFGGLDVGE